MGKTLKCLLIVFVGMFFLSSCAKPAERNDQSGVTSGNSNNGSRYVMHEGWIYYTVQESAFSFHGVDSELRIGGFWKMRPDFSQRQRIAKEDAERLVIVGSKIYTQTGFVYDTDSQSYTQATWAKEVSAHGASSFFIYDQSVYFGGLAIDLDGSNLRIFAADSTVVRMDVYQGWIYFNDPNLEKSSLCKIRPEGTDKTIVTTGVVDDFVIEDNKLYYPNAEDNGTLYVLNLNTGDATKLADIPVKSLNYYAGKLYYLYNREDDGELLSEIYRINSDGFENERIVASSAGIDSLTILDGWLYYGGLSMDVGEPQYRMSLSTGEIEESKLDVSYAQPAASDQEYVKGNTQMSFFVEKDGWLYFAKVTADDDRGTYRSKPDGSQMTKISDEVAYSLMIVEDWIYYSNFDYRMMLFRMRLDGTDVEMVVDQDSSYATLKDEWIYISTEVELFRIRTDSTGYTKLSNESRFDIVGEKIILSELGNAGDDAPGIFTMDLDGKNKKRIYTGFNFLLDTSEEWIYFAKHDGFGNTDGFTYRMKQDGSSIQIFEDTESFSIMVPYNGWYYAVSDDGKSIYRTKANGTAKELIMRLPIRLESMQIIKDRILVSTYDSDAQNFRVDLYDLNGKRKIEFYALDVKD